MWAQQLHVSLFRNIVPLRTSKKHLTEQHDIIFSYNSTQNKSESHRSQLPSLFFFTPANQLHVCAGTSCVLCVFHVLPTSWSGGFFPGDRPALHGPPSATHHQHRRCFPISGRTKLVSSCSASHYEQSHKRGDVRREKIKEAWGRDSAPHKLPLGPEWSCWVGRKRGGGSGG